MDRQEFDDFTRRFATGYSRRGAIGGLVAAFAAGTWARNASAQEGLAGPGEPCESTQDCRQTGGALVCADNLIAQDGPLTCCRTEGGTCSQDSHCCGAAVCVEGVCLGQAEPGLGEGLPLGAECSDTSQCVSLSRGVVVCGDNFLSEDGPLNCCLEEGSSCLASNECCGTYNCEAGRCGAAAGDGDLAPGQFCVTSGQCSQALGPAVCAQNAFSAGAPVCCLQEASTCSSDQECCGNAVCADNGIGADGGLNCCGNAGAGCGSDAGCCADLFCLNGACQPL